MGENSKHVPEMDFLRVFAILAVVAIHVSEGYFAITELNALKIVNVGIDIFAHFAVPLFIFLSGFLLYNKYNRNYSLKEFYQKRFLRIIPPYLFFTTVYLALTCAVVSIQAGVFIPPTFGEVFFAYFAAEGYLHLWFILLIIELYLVYPLIVKVFNFFADRNMEILFLALALLLELWWEYAGNFHIQLFGYDLYVLDKLFFCRIFFFVLGMSFCRHYPAIKQFVLRTAVRRTALITTVCYVIIATILWYIGVTTYEMSDDSLMFYAMLLQPLFYVFTFMFLFDISNRLVNANRKFTFLSLVSAYSFGIYLVHLIFLVIFGEMLGIVGVTADTVLYYPLMFVLVFGCSMLLVHCMRKLPFYRYIMG